MPIKQIILHFLLLISCRCIISRNLELVYTNTTLFSSGSGMSAVHDGNDSIFLVGASISSGCDTSSGILEYSIIADSLKIIGSSNKGWQIQSVLTRGNGIFLFGGSAPLTDQILSMTVYPFNLTEVNQLPNAEDSAVYIYDNKYSVYSFCGRYSDSIVEYFVHTNIVQTLSTTLPSPRYSCSGVWDDVSESVYIFGGRDRNDHSVYKDILRFDSIKKTVTKLDVELPTPTFLSVAIWNGKEAYIISGVGGDNTVPAPLLRFNPSTNEISVIPVDNFPKYIFGSAYVFVEKLSRIYLFGGDHRNSRDSDRIMYIDLLEEEQTTTITARPPTDCSDKENGTRIPNTFCCESYYECTNQVPVRKSCPDFLQFDPSNALCTFPHLVNCGVQYD